MIKGKYLITAGIAAAVLALTACSGGQGSASGKETQKTAAQKAEAGAEAQASQYVKFKPEEAKEVMDSDDALIVVDVRIIPGGNDELKLYDLAYFMTTRNYIPYIRKIVPANEPFPVLQEKGFHLPDKPCL